VQEQDIDPPGPSGVCAPRQKRPHILFCTPLGPGASETALDGPFSTVDEKAVSTLWARLREASTPVLLAHAVAVMLGRAHGYWLATVSVGPVGNAETIRSGPEGAFWTKTQNIASAGG
jgi:hypothetical protein